MKLSILIPSLIDRAESLNLLKIELERQVLENGLLGQVETITLVDNRELTIGAKRNELLKRANGEYLCYFDDDDYPSRKYIKRIFEGIKEKPDCCSLMGLITWNGENPEIFEHSIKYSEYKTNPPTNGIRYERYPNHLNVIKSEIAKQFKFEEINFGEDTKWATRLFMSGLLKTEYYIHDVLYEYRYKRK